MKQIHGWFALAGFLVMLWAIYTLALPVLQEVAAALALRGLVR